MFTIVNFHFLPIPSRKRPANTNSQDVRGCPEHPRSQWSISLTEYWRVLFALNLSPVYSAVWEKGHCCFSGGGGGLLSVSFEGTDLDGQQHDLRVERHLWGKGWEATRTQIWDKEQEKKNVILNCSAQKSIRRLYHSQNFPFENGNLFIPAFKRIRYTVVDQQAIRRTYVLVIKQTNGLWKISICHATRLAPLNISFRKEQPKDRQWKSHYLSITQTGNRHQADAAFWDKHSDETTHCSNENVQMNLSYVEKSRIWQLLDWAIYGAVLACEIAYSEVVDLPGISGAPLPCQPFSTTFSAGQFQ